MPYNPREETQNILARAWGWVQSVPYTVTARWVFYRLLQDGTYGAKAGYKHLLGILSKARKEFYAGWRPWTLADDSRRPLLMQRSGYYTIYMRGTGFDDEKDWLERLKEELNCPLDRWADQPGYVEIWFEAAAMQAQFQYYANENIPLLAFHGDISIPEKWRTARRLADWWLKHRKPVNVYYFGDMDPKGMIIPQSAWTDIRDWVYTIILHDEDMTPDDFDRTFFFTRVGLTPGQEDTLDIPENPERPGTYQWEALSDEQAEMLIDETNRPLNLKAFERAKKHEDRIAAKAKKNLFPTEGNQ